MLLMPLCETYVIWRSGYDFSAGALPDASHTSADVIYHYLRAGEGVFAILASEIEQ
jgi:hypothetical protein